ncbi:MAG: DNA translocase FtsK [bacterium]
MAKKPEIKQSKQNAQKELPPTRETNHVVAGLGLTLVGAVSLGGLFGGAGVVGFTCKQALWGLLGVESIIVPIGLITGGILVMRKRRIEASVKEWVSLSLGMISILGLSALYSASWGGLIGSGIATGASMFFDTTFAFLVLGVLSITSFIFFFDRSPNLIALWEKIRGTKITLPEFKKEDEEEVEEEEQAQTISAAELALDEAPVPPKKEVKKEMVINDSNNADSLLNISLFKKKNSSGDEAYTPPPLTLLEKDKGKANVGDVKANANIIRRTLLNFGIEVEMDEVTIGPTVTRYALKPAQGVKLSRIVGLQSDLALALAAHPIRIEAPIPGKSLVGIEIPNKTKSTVGLANLLSDPNFHDSPIPLLAAVGRNISGKGSFKSIAKMPHLLIAGTTGSGKSVTIHAIIASLLYKHGPDELRFIFVDPKRVELTLYNGIPHLLTPVITEPKKAILSLKWAASEMNRRYDILEGHSVRDITSYHKLVEKNKGKSEEEQLERMPYIVIIIDELADIMQAYPRELEAAIVRLAQMSRAVGIHLILSTQRPEVNVITGLIKANVPSRIALRVPTQIDSRTILDAGGAEKLLGQGDMLAVVGGDGQPERLQSAYISEDEVKNIVAYLKEEYRDDIRDMIELTGNITADKTMWSEDLGGGSGGSDDDDELYEDARACVIEAGKGSTSYIQRKLKVGYARAARLMDMLEERGVIGPSDGAKPREVLETGLKHSASDALAEEMGL